MGRVISIPMIVSKELLRGTTPPMASCLVIPSCLSPILDKYTSDSPFQNIDCFLQTLTMEGTPPVHSDIFVPAVANPGASPVPAEPASALQGPSPQIEHLLPVRRQMWMILMTLVEVVLWMHLVVDWLLVVPSIGAVGNSLFGGTAAAAAAFAGPMLMRVWPGHISTGTPHWHLAFGSGIRTRD